MLETVIFPYDGRHYLPRIRRIGTGSRHLDDLLLGGIETHKVTEFFGPSGIGKTQICHTLAVMATNTDTESKVIFIDTHGTFRPERIASIADARNFDIDSTLSNILYVRALTSHHQELIVEKVRFHLSKYNKVSLLIVDSVINNYKAEFRRLTVM